jgi:phosphatidate cytidylyltransferase
MAPLPDDWKILGEGEDVPFEENDDVRKARRAHSPKPTVEGETADSMPSRPPKWDNPEFRKRVISALILGPLVLAAVAAGGVAFYTLVLMTAVLMMREWDAMIEHRLSSAWGWAGVAYVTATCLSFIVLRNESLTLMIYLLAVVWATDIGAYFAGRQIGGPKLAPRLSPKKTWAGLFGGMLSAVTVGGILSFFFAFPTHIFQAAVLGAALAVVAQIGDLFESWMKREAGMKDSSALIPGHGGILDRVDGLTFTAPLLVVTYYALMYLQTQAMATPAL